MTMQSSSSSSFAFLISVSPVSTAVLNTRTLEGVKEINYSRTSGCDQLSLVTSFSKY